MPNDTSQDEAPRNEPQALFGMSMPDYLADPAPGPSLQASTIKQLLTTAPAAVFAENPRLNPDYVEEEKDSASRNAADFGSAAHAVFVEGDYSLIRFVDADSWRSKLAKEVRAEAEAFGQIPLLLSKQDQLGDMASRCLDTCKRNPDIGHLFKDRKELIPEAVLIWHERGVWHRCRPDLAAKNKACFIHYKTTRASIHPPSLPMLASSMEWDVIMAHYEAAARGALDVPEIEQYFVVQSVKPPYLVAIVALDEAFREVGEMRRDQAIPLWRHCLETGNWPAYPPQTLSLAAPAWHENKAVTARDVMRSAPDADEIQRGIDFHRPD